MDIHRLFNDPYRDINDQQIMEMMIRDISETGKEQFLDEIGEYKDVSDWKGVTTDDEGNVIRIDWQMPKVNLGGGTIDLSYIPFYIKSFNVRDQDLEGNLNVAVLPRSLVSFNMRCSKLKGKVVGSHLPPKMEFFDVHSNKINRFIGDSLPTTIRVCSLRDNNISGPLVLPKEFPPRLVHMDLGDNSLSGPLILPKEFPPNFKYMSLKNNLFHQESLIVGKFPNTMDIFDIQGNKIEFVYDSEGWLYTDLRIKKSPYEK